MRKAFILLIYLYTAPVFGQETYSWPENTYQSSSNPLYWKNRPPYPGYWQQDVHYKIEAKLDDKTHILTGTEEITYWNNSPDTLKEIFFHLYMNVSLPGSYADDLYKNNGSKVKYGYYAKDSLGVEIDEIMVSAAVYPTEKSGNVISKKVNAEIDNTIMRVRLFAPLPPGHSILIHCRFRTHFDEGTIRRRMKIFSHNGFKHFDGVHWYPRIAVYDRRNGWNTDQHLGREFYGDYGTYDVALSLPNNYILDGTGVLLNEKEVLPDSLRQTLDIKNFAKKPLESKPSVIIKPDGTWKTWRFHAENVHDFGWTADPTYRIGEAEWNGIRCIALAQEEHASRWQNTADYLAKVIEVYSRDFGMYAWPKIIVADARDGMEYNMLTLCGGLDPDNRGLIAHEVGHEWFYGMVGSNETYRAFLDEGFTQFIQEWAQCKIDGPYDTKTPPKSKYLRKHKHTEPIREERLFHRYLQQAYYESAPTLSTHSDHFEGAVGHGGGYGMVYYKTSTMLTNLQYYLGDSLFKKAMQHYFNQWKFCHPYPEDFTTSINQFTRVNLSQFFDDWIASNKYIDYKVKSVRKGEKEGEYKVTIERKGRLAMPIDFTVVEKNGDKHSYHISNWYFEKETGAIILPRWIGWDKIRPTYTATIQSRSGIQNVIIDTTNRLADVYAFDNRLKKKRKLYFDSQVHRTPDRTAYEMYWRPDIWYNSIDGLKAGLHLHGNYFNQRKFFWLTAWYNTRIPTQEKEKPSKIFSDLISFNFAYSNPIISLDKDLSWFTELRALDGLYLGSLGLSKNFRKNYTASIDYKAMYRPGFRDLSYLLYRSDWFADEHNNTVNASLAHSYTKARHSGRLELNLRTPGPFSDYSYATLSPVLVHTISGKKVIFRNRWFASYSSGSSIAPESMLYLAQASPEEMMENKFVRSRGFVPESWVGYGAGTNHFHHGGGLNLRGYSGYRASDKFETANSTELYYVYSGTGGAAWNAELEFDAVFKKFKPKTLSRFLHLSTYLFWDGGIIKAGVLGSDQRWSRFRMDAGLGTALTIKNWGALQKVKPLTIRFDMPLYLSDVPFAETSNFKFRWVMGVGRAF